MCRLSLRTTITSLGFLVALIALGAARSTVPAWADEDDIVPVPCTSTMLSSDVTIVSATYTHNG